MLANLETNAPANVPIPFTRDNLPELVCHLTTNAINKFERKISGKGAVRAGKGFTLFISVVIMSATWRNFPKLTKNLYRVQAISKKSLPRDLFNLFLTQY